MPTSAPTPAPTSAPTTALTSPPTVEPTAASTPASTQRPTPEPTEAPEPTPDAAAAQELLISYVHPDLQSTCVVRDPVYEGEFVELVSITCGPDDLPFDLSLFDSAADMQRAYNADIADAETPPVTGGLCTEGVFEGVYGAEDTPLGRLNCRWHTSSSTGEMYRVLEWTNDELNVIGYISNREDVHSWEELIAFRATQAGPFPAE